MLDIETFNKFIGKANQAHQQFTLWFEVMNEFTKHQARWNADTIDYPDDGVFGCRYKNFFGVSITSVQHGWILGTARLFDKAFHGGDKEKNKPRISLDYVLSLIEDSELQTCIKSKLITHQEVIASVRMHRHNFLAHNDAGSVPTKIEAGIEELFEWLEEVVALIKEKYPHLNTGKIINIKHNEKLAKFGVKELFFDLVAVEDIIK